MDEKKRQERRERLAFLATLNKMKCEASPIWGSDLIDAVTMIPRSEYSKSSIDAFEKSTSELPWSRIGKCHFDCLNAVEPMAGRRNYETLWSETNTLRQMVHTPEQYLDELKDCIQR